MGLWLRRLSYLAILGFPLSVLGTRLALFDFRVGFQGLRYTVYLAVIVIVVGLIVAVLQRRSNPPGARAGLVAAAICLLPLFGIGSQLVTAKSVPAIHNISTDTTNPPDFFKIVELRSAQNNPLYYDVDELAEIQQAAYPEIKTLYTPLSKSDAHDRALVVAEALGWEIVDQNAVAGIIEATATTALWNFKDDIVIRVSDEGNQVAIDLRSVSRVGQSDLGANAKRIKKFMDAFATLSNG